jgi:hypothetical protein
MPQTLDYPRSTPTPSPAPLRLANPAEGGQRGPVNGGRNARRERWGRTREVSRALQVAGTCVELLMRILGMNGASVIVHIDGI